MGRFVRLALVCAVLVGVAAGVAYARDHLGSIVGADGTITACVEPSGTVELVDAGASCKRNERQVQWNQHGAKGDPGPAGEDGVDGTDGKDGRSLVGTAIPAGGEVCGGNGGIAVAYDDGTPVGDLCNGARGEAGPAGPAGAPGTASLASLEGSACALPDTTAGTVHVSVGPGGAIALTCTGSGTGGGGDDGGGASQCEGTLPSYPNMTTTCDAISGLSFSCVAGYVDLDGDVETGCEVDLTSDVNNCGEVGDGPPGLHATWACVGGSFVLLACDPGWFDLDGLASDGCEAQADAFEPNDDVSAATPLTGGSHDATIAPAGDVDWYLIPYACSTTSTAWTCRAAASVSDGVTIGIAPGGTQTSVSDAISGAGTTPPSLPPLAVVVGGQPGAYTINVS